MNSSRTAPRYWLQVDGSCFNEAAMNSSRTGRNGHAPPTPLASFNEAAMNSSRTGSPPMHQRINAEACFNEAAMNSSRKVFDATITAGIPAASMRPR